MLRYKTETRPGLVALYDIRPGNGAGQFLQPWSPHRATQSGRLGDSIGRQETPHTPHSTTEMQDSYHTSYDLMICGHNLTLSH